MRFGRLHGILNLASHHFIKSGLLIFIYLNSLFSFATIALISAQINLSHFIPVTLWIFNVIGIFLLIVLRQKCHSCQQQAGKQIITALDKMSKGDLDWKLTLHRGTELSEVVSSVNKAQELLTRRISNLQMKTKEIAAVEDFLFDSIQCDGNFRPHTVKALRKLKICLNRLKSDVADFELSLDPGKEEISEKATLT